MTYLCVCVYVLSFACGADWHYPLRCDLMTKWQKKCSDDSETFNWIAANTKDCPQCKMPIEKNGGCNHMVSVMALFFYNHLSL